MGHALQFQASREPVRIGTAQIVEGRKKKLNQSDFQVTSVKKS
jgi:hypothetical protein